MPSKCHNKHADGNCGDCIICKDQEKFDSEARKATEQENLKPEEETE